MIAPTDRLDLIGDLVSRLGSDRFDESFFRLFDEILGIDHCTVFEYFGEEKARIIMTVGKSFDSVSKDRSLAYDYINGFFHEDPYFLELIDRDESEDPRWRRGDPSKIEDDDYREKFYESPNLAHELILSHKDKDHTLISTLYRSESKGAFTDKDQRQASQYVGLSLKLLHKHIELLKYEFDIEGRPTTKPHQRIFDLVVNLGTLSHREAEVCAMILQGYTTHGISLNLDISVNTVSTHRKRAYQKLGIATQNELFCRCFDVLAEA